MVACKNCGTSISEADVLSGRRLCTTCLRPWRDSTRETEPKKVFVFFGSTWKFVKFLFLFVVTWPYRAIFGDKK